ncbi:MAG: flagellar hook protein FlgE [Gammaproteobacteria bacterium]
MTFSTALSGLNAAKTDLDVTGNNIANSATNGFKESRAEFADVYAASFLNVGSVSPGDGVRVADIAQQFTQGNVEFTNNNLDLALNGDGFFVLSDNGALAYTRAGAYKVDREGFVVNSDGLRLQAFPATITGTTTSFNTGALSDIQINTSDAPPQATTTATINVNLDASESAIAATIDPTDTTTYNHATSMIIYDSLGVSHTATMYFQKTADNLWDVALYIDGDTTTPISTDSLTFDSSGNLTAPAGGIVSYTIPTATLGTGAADINMDFNYSTTTQFGSVFGVNNLIQDGFTSGRLNGITVSDTGVVFATFTNGQSIALGQVALAKFPNDQGLAKLGNTNWAESFESGGAIFGAAGTSNFGAIQSGALEASNVDLTEQLVNLIIAQRNFQANAETITTEDEITQTILNI